MAGARAAQQMEVCGWGGHGPFLEDQLGLEGFVQHDWVTLVSAHRSSASPHVIARVQASVSQSSVHLTFTECLLCALPPRDNGKAMGRQWLDLFVDNEETSVRRGELRTKGSQGPDLQGLQAGEFWTACEM